MEKEPEFPVVQARSIRLNLDPNNPDDYLLVCATHDSIQVFPDSKYDYLRYYDCEDKEVKAYWLSEDVLADLYDFGIPLTKREYITDFEYNLYLKVVGKKAVEETVEVDLIEEECNKVHAHFEEELNWYTTEWIEGRDGTC